MIEAALSVQKCVLILLSIHSSSFALFPFIKRLIKTDSTFDKFSETKFEMKLSTKSEVCERVEERKKS